MTRTQMAIVWGVLLLGVVVGFGGRSIVIHQALASVQATEYVPASSTGGANPLIGAGACGA